MRSLFIVSLLENLGIHIAIQKPSIVSDQLIMCIFGLAI